MSLYSLVTLLKRRNLTISVAESMTGGEIAASITKVPGCSEVFKGGLVVYSNESKEKLLGITPHDILAFGVVSKEVSIRMAEECSKVLNTKIAVSITGDAGPTLSEKNTTFRTFVAITKDGNTISYELPFISNNRWENIEKTKEFIVDKLILLLTY